MSKKISNLSGTKKDMIAKMLMQHGKKYSAKQIAHLVGTTEGNVFKEKSRLKATGVLTDKRLSIFSHSIGNETLTLAQAEAKTLATRSDPGSLTDLPPLKPEDMKRMYSEFQDGQTPVEVIVANGFNPFLVEFEYNRFCRMKGLNLNTLPHELIEVLRSTNSQVPAGLFQKIEDKEITCNDDIKELVEFASTSSYSGGELSAIHRIKYGESIGAFQSLPCSICGKPMRGALIEPESEIGRKLIRSIDMGALQHDECLFGSLSKG